MAKQVINVGSSANDGTGDKNRVAFQKINENFTELYDSIPTIDEAPIDGLTYGRKDAEWVEVIEPIPLSGTEVDKPITGDLEIKNPIDFGTRKIITYYDEEKTKYSAVIFDDGGNVMLESKQDFYTKLLLNSGTIEFHTDNPDSSGINPTVDFRTLTNWTDTGLTQKMYVDDKFVQKGVDNATTVVLSSATLNSTYPTATTGFRVYCASIVLGAMTYEKTPTGWLGFSCIVP